MILLHSIWNQRRSYVWIFLELLFVSFFLWVVIDPIYFAVANCMIDNGYDADSCYMVQAGEYYQPTQKGYRKEADNDSVRQVAIANIIQTVRDEPDVSSFVFVRLHAIPGSGNWNGGILSTDTMSQDREAAFWALIYEGFDIPGSDFIGTYGLRLFPSERQLPQNTPRAIYISQSMAEGTFGTTDCVGRNLYNMRSSEPLTVAGVFRDVKMEIYSQPLPVVLYASNDPQGSYGRYFLPAVVRLRHGADPRKVEERLREKFAAVGNYYLRDFINLKTQAVENRETVQTYNQLVLRTGLSAFGVLCIMLGMLGTFWVRCNARRGDIAVMRALGASRSAVGRHFLGEALLLVTLGLVFALPLCYAYAHYIGLATPDPVLGDKVFINEHYPQNVPWMHFLHLTAISWVLLMVTTIVAVVIPVSRALRTQPVEGLKEE